MVSEHIDCHAHSTRRVRFDRVDVEKEITCLAEQAIIHWPALKQAFDRIRAEGWQYVERVTNKVRMLPVVAETLGEFLVHGPTGAPSARALADFHHHLQERRAHGIRPGSEMIGRRRKGEKTPRFDNRIVAECALLDGLRVCGVWRASRPEDKIPES